MSRKTLFWLTIILLVIVTSLVLGLVVGRKIPSEIQAPSEGQKADIQLTGPFTIIPGNRVFEDMNLYSVFIKPSILSEQKPSILSPGISEHIWGFKVKEKDYLFRTLAVSCEYKKSQGSYIKLGIGLDSLTIGENYTLIFLGLEKPLDESVLTMWERAKEDLPGCKEVWGGLGSDVQNPDKLRRFFTEGDTSGFKVDDQGIVDLTKVITLIEIKE